MADSFIEYLYEEYVPTLNTLIRIGFLGGASLFFSALVLIPIIVGSLVAGGMGVVGGMVAGFVACYTAVEYSVYRNKHTDTTVFYTRWLDYAVFGEGKV